MTLTPALPRRATALLVAAALAGACGRGENQSADRNGADTTSVDTSATGPYGNRVGENKEMKDSSFGRAAGALDSLQASGRTPAEGIDSLAARAQATTANEPGSDTSRLRNNNRERPGGGPPSGQRSPQ
jgi:hypothetical protein